MSTRTILNDSMEIIIVKPAVVRFSHQSVLVTTFFKQMKTVFKVGMEVWDKTISPNKGKVIEVLEDTKFDFPIKVEFDDGLAIQYTNEGCFVKSKGAINTLSSSDYSIELEGFEQKAPVPTFKEAWIEAERFYEPKIKDDEEGFKGYPSQELADASEALRRLLFLRDYYNEGWQPDFSKETKNIKYCISKDASGRFMKYDYYNYDFNNVLIFKSKQIRSKFWDEQLELMKIAKPLL